MSTTRPRTAAVACLKGRGFSLLELLVVLFVIMLVTSLVTLNVSSGGSDLKLESQLRNLAGVASYALDEAEFQGVDYGLLVREIDDDGQRVYSYGWRERRPEGWREPASGKELFGEEKLPPDIELLLELEDVAVSEISPADDEGEDAQTPQVILYSSGETTSGAIDIRRREGGELLWRVEWDFLGRFKLLRAGEEGAEF